MMRPEEDERKLTGGKSPGPGALGLEAEVATARARAEHLRALLRDYLRPRELKIIISEVYGPDVLHCIPWRGAFVEVVFEIVEVLERHGHIDERLFNRLLGDVPGKAEEIKLIARLYGCPMVEGGLRWPRGLKTGRSGGGTRRHRTMLSFIYPLMGLPLVLLVLYLTPPTGDRVLYAIAAFLIGPVGLAALCLRQNGAFYASVGGGVYLLQTRSAATAQHGADASVTASVTAGSAQMTASTLLPVMAAALGVMVAAVPVLVEIRDVESIPADGASAQTTDERRGGRSNVSGLSPLQSSSADSPASGRQEPADLGTPTEPPGSPSSTDQWCEMESDAWKAVAAVSTFSSGSSPGRMAEIGSTLNAEDPFESRKLQPAAQSPVLPTPGVSDAVVAAGDGEAGSSGPTEVDPESALQLGKSLLYAIEGTTRFDEGSAVKAAPVTDDPSSTEPENESDDPIAKPSMECGKGMRFIQGGTFAPESAKRSITLPDLCFDAFEVNVEDYRRCVAAGKCFVPYSGGQRDNWSANDRARHPVNGVSWKQADAYCRFVGKRLPSEWEWEWAAGGSEGRKYPWGSSEPTCDCVVMKRGSAGCGEDRTAEVGSRKCGFTPEGLEDMGGNLREWTSTFGERAVVRGGSLFDGNPGRLRTIARSSIKADTQDHETGFRCVRGR